MRYQVFQDGKPADSTGYPEIKNWKNSIFDTFNDAVRYANAWAYPFDNSGSLREMQLNVPIDMSMGEFPVMMEIREVE